MEIKRCRDVMCGVRLLEKTFFSWYWVLSEIIFHSVIDLIHTLNETAVKECHLSFLNVGLNEFFICYLKN